MDFEVILTIALCVLGGLWGLACYFWGKADGYAEARHIRTTPKPRWIIDQKD